MRGRVGSGEKSLGIGGGVPVQFVTRSFVATRSIQSLLWPFLPALFP